jgi:hypothetical protein
MSTKRPIPEYSVGSLLLPHSAHVQRIPVLWGPRPGHVLQLTGAAADPKRSREQSRAVLL